MGEPRPGYARYVLGVLVLGYLLNSLDRSILGILLEPIRVEFGLRDTQLGLLGGLAFALFYSVFGLPLGRWADRSSRKNVLAAAILVWSLMTALCGMAVGFATLVLARIGTAIGESGGSPPSHSLIADYFPPERRATAFAIFALGAPAGATLGGFLGGLGNELFGWRTTFVLAGLPGLLLAPLVFLTITEPRVKAGVASALAHTEQAVAPLSRVASFLWKRRSFRHLCLACALHSVAMYSAATFNASYLIRSHGWGTADIGKLLGLIGVLGVIGTFAGGYFSDRLSRERGDDRWYMWVPAISMGVLVPMQLIAYLSTDTTTLVWAFALTGLAGTVFFGPSFATTQALAAPRMRATAASVLIFVKTMIGMGLGPFLVGFMSDSLAPAAGEHSLRYALLILAGFDGWAAVHFVLGAHHLRGDLEVVERKGIEPSTFALRTRRSPN